MTVTVEQVMEAMQCWTTENIKAKITNSDLWVARAIYRLAIDFDAIKIEGSDTEHASSDKQYFKALKDFFAENGHFTNRQIFLARRKIRDSYIEYLTQVANLRIPLAV